MRAIVCLLLAAVFLSPCSAEPAKEKPTATVSPRQELVAAELMRQMEAVAAELEGVKTVESARLAAQRITQIARGPLTTAVNHARTLGALEESSVLELAERLAERRIKLAERLEAVFLALLSAEPGVREEILPAWIEVNDVFAKLPEHPQEDEDDDAAPDDAPPPVIAPPNQAE